MSNRFVNNEFCSKENLLTILQIMRTRNIGPITFLKLYSKFKEPKAILKEVERILRAKGNLPYLASRQSVENEYNKTLEYGGNIISIFDEKYPELLSECEDPPITISYIGDIQNIPTNSVGFVGARNCSANGISLAYKFAKELADNNFCIISGLAKGIDGASHKGALEADKYNENLVPTVGVIGGGIDNIYPKDNEILFTKIARDGVIISEYPFGTKPKAENFPKRNRIISALSKGVLIIEATLKSGSLITARIALEQNREVMCIPGFPMDERAKGCNKLIKDGAHIITNIKDVLEIIEESKLEQFDMDLDSNFKEDISMEFKNNNIEINEIEEEENQELDSNDILNFIGHSPIDINEVIKISGLKASIINSIILENEIEGNLIRHPGNKVSKIG